MHGGTLAIDGSTFRSNRASTDGGAILLTGGELFDAIHKGYSEKEAASHLRQILSGLAFLHSKNIVHADIATTSQYTTVTHQSHSNT